MARNRLSWVRFETSALLISRRSPARLADDSDSLGYSPRGGRWPAAARSPIPAAGDEATPPPSPDG